MDFFIFSHGAAGCRPPQARSQFKSRSTANNVSILVPVPSDADSPKFKTSTGSTKWIPEKNVVQWNIKSFPVSVSCRRPLQFHVFICSFESAPSTVTVADWGLATTQRCVCRPPRQGGKEYMMRAHFGLPSVESEELDAKRPVTVNFEIPYFTVSGIQVGPPSTRS